VVDSGKLTRSKWGFGAGGNACDAPGVQPAAGKLAFEELSSYNTPGRVTSKKLRYYRTFGGSVRTVELNGSWAYNNEGQVTGVGYPTHREGSVNAGREVSFGYDSLARMNSVQTKLATQGDPTPGWQNVIGSVQFNAFGGITSLSHLGVTETRTYNVLGQMTRMTKGSFIDVEYRFSTTQNDGKILSQKNWLTGEDVTYQYDQLERLISASTTNNSSWGLSWSYDGFGNRLAQTVTQGAGPTNTVLVDGNTNRISSAGYSYDANGNMTLMPKGSGSMTLDYDYGNRMTKATHPDGAEDYRYAPDNRRIWRNQGKTVCNSVDTNNVLQFATAEGNAEQVIFYGLDGRKMGVYCVVASTEPALPLVVTASEENVYYGGRLVAKRTGVQTQFSTGLVTDFTMDRLHSKGDGSKFYPYGESRTSAAGDDREQFATYTRDQGTGLDYAYLRYYSPGLGRFLCPDPKRQFSSLGESGSWNKFTYAENLPVHHTDVTGAGYDCTIWFWEFDDGSREVFDVQCVDNNPDRNPERNPDPDPEPQGGGGGGDAYEGWTIGSSGSFDIELRGIITDIRNTIFDPGNEECLRLFTDSVLGIRFNWASNRSAFDQYLGQLHNSIAFSGYVQPGHNPIAQTFATTPTTAIVPGVPISIVINHSNAWHHNQGSLTVPEGDGSITTYAGGLGITRRLILLHELAHLVRSINFEHNDGGSIALIDKNNQDLLKTCNKVIH
jgi:RHS repeat-associated protein